MATSAELGRKVREAREEAGLSQKALGEMLQPPRSHAAISDIERGETRVGATDISQIARILGKAITYFLRPRGRASSIRRSRTGAAY